MFFVWRQGNNCVAIASNTGRGYACNIILILSKLLWKHHTTCKIVRFTLRRPKRMWQRKYACGAKQTKWNISCYTLTEQRYLQNYTIASFDKPNVEERKTDKSACNVATNKARGWDYPPNWSAQNANARCHVTRIPPPVAICQVDLVNLLQFFD